MKTALSQLFDLRHDQNDNEAIDLAIRDKVRIEGTNLWVLIFAILIASVGLNVNSTAVIIGAMLISPLMGPLLGIGYGAGINDYRLIQRSARNLGIFVVISLTTSTLYFLVTPLSQAQTELVARTTPTIWDVLIAFFGGFAGIVAQTRRDESTVIPGAAIATALMPPLCTAGYGLATANKEFFFGAFYLFSINVFFISFATLLFVKLMRMPQHEEIDDSTRRRIRSIIAVCVIAMVVPSIFLTYQLVRDQIFLSSAQGLIGEAENQPGTILLSKEISAKDRRIKLIFSGDPLPDETTAKLHDKLLAGGFSDARLSIQYLAPEKTDIAGLKQELQRDMFTSTLGQLEEQNAKIQALNLELAKVQAEKATQNRFVLEVLAQYPDIQKITISEGEQIGRETEHSEQVLMVVLETKSTLSDDDMNRLNAWIKVRFPDRRPQAVQLADAGPARPPAQSVKGRIPRKRKM